jgi:DNA invertase Pin-like site-specific DNA recombinase
VQIGYMRVSKADGSQSTDLQRDALGTAGVATRRLYEDRASGRLDARPGLDAALKALRRGDTLVVWKLDRLGRDLRHLINIVHDLSTRGIGFKVLSGHGASIDTTTPAGKLVFGIFAALAEFERDLISERTKAGLASARARTKRRGALQDDCGESAAGHGRHGTKGNEGDRFMQRTGDYPANALPACRARWDAAQGWAEGN